MWINGEPRTPGYYLLQFSGGDRFVVVHAFIDEEDDFVMEDLDLGGYVMCDYENIITSNLPIPKPPEREGIS